MQYKTRIDDRITELVDGLGLRVGDKLPGERDIVEIMGYSRAVIRECMTVLAYNGHITREWGHRCVYVREWTHPTSQKPIA